jgi:hypothetical protein
MRACPLHRTATGHPPAVSRDPCREVAGGPARRNVKRVATDIVLVEDGAVIFWPRTGEQFHIAEAAYAMARVQARLA